MDDSNEENVFSLHLYPLAKINIYTQMSLWDIETACSLRLQNINIKCLIELELNADKGL